MAEAKKTLRITQVKSAIGKKYDQGRTLKALGLGKIGRSVDQVDNPCVRGMIFKIKHLVEVEEVKAEKKAAAKPKAAAKSKAEAKAEAKPKAETKAKAPAKPKADAKPKAAAKPKAKKAE